MDIKGIIEMVSRHYGVDVTDVLSASRNGKVKTARQVALYIARKCTTASLPDISATFGKSHATVIHAVKTVEECIGVDAALGTEVEQLQRQLESPERPKTPASTPEPRDVRWRRIQAFIQEAGIVLDYLHWRVLCKCDGDQPASALFLMTADGDGELTEEMIVARLEAIARQARAGFVDGPGFPIFASLYRNTEEGK